MEFGKARPPRKIPDSKAKIEAKKLVDNIYNLNYGLLNGLDENRGLDDLIGWKFAKQYALICIEENYQKEWDLLEYISEHLNKEAHEKALEYIYNKREQVKQEIIKQ